MQLDFSTFQPVGGGVQMAPICSAAPLLMAFETCRESVLYSQPSKRGIKQT